MLVDHPINFLPIGATKPLLALNKDGNKVVIKAMINPTFGKILLNEYLTGNLANAIKLPWPTVHLAELGNKSVEFFQKHSIELYSHDCVVLDYIENLIQINWPALPSELDFMNEKDRKLFAEANRKHLAKYFSNPEGQKAFYGKALFETWLLMKDTKYDTLFSRSNSTPFFLDGSHAFGGSDWEYENMEYSSHSIFSLSPYLQGVLNDLSLYEEWLKRIQQLSDQYIKTLFKSIPSSWGIKEKQIDFLINLLIVKRKQFIENWKEEIEFQRSTKNLL